MITCLIKVVLDNHMALDYLLTEQDVYAIANTTCYVQINSSGEVENPREQAYWLQQILPDYGPLILLAGYLQMWAPDLELIHKQGS